MTKVLWLSRRDMTEEQLAALKKKVGDDVAISKFDRNIQRAYELQPWIKENDIIATSIAAPKNFLLELLMLAGNKPVILAHHRCESIKCGDDDKVRRTITIFEGWKQLRRKIEVVADDFYWYSE